LIDNGVLWANRTIESGETIGEDGDAKWDFRFVNCTTLVAGFHWLPAYGTSGSPPMCWRAGGLGLPGARHRHALYARYRVLVARALFASALVITLFFMGKPLARAAIIIWFFCY